MKWLRPSSTSTRVGRDTGRDTRGSTWAGREQEFHERAIDWVGYDDFGDASYREPLRILLECFDHEARYHLTGRMLAEHQLMTFLVNRLKSERWWKLRPRALEVKIERPIFICGMVRTGSTALHYLMGSNPDMQALPFWLATHPQPRPPRFSWPAARDFQHGKAELEMMYAAGSNLEAIHHIFAEGPEECRHFLAQSFTDDCFEVGSTVPTFARWYRTHKHTKSYERHKKLVQLVGSYDEEKRWLLKYPVHLRHIDALFEVYPDACIVWTHRDPASVLPSYVSLCTSFRRLQEEAADPLQVAREQLEAWSAACLKGLAVRKGREAQFHDVYFHDFMRDPIGTVAGIYAKFDVEFTALAKSALTAWSTENPAHKHGKHTYDKDDFGISRGEIYEHFGRYMSELGVARESNRETIA
jgi:hypothetical protein